MSFSQGLKPIVQHFESDTLFCFLPDQSRMLAQKISAEVYNDSIMALILLENTQLRQITDFSEQVILNQQHRLKLNHQVAINHKQQLKVFERSLADKDQSIQRLKRKKKVTVIGLIALGLLGWIK